jgi:hypothetical protein
MNESITTPFSTATPDSAMKPTPAVIENGRPRAARATIPPVSANGTPLNTSRASRTDPKAANSSRKTSRSASGTTIASRVRAAIRFSNWPPHSSQ